MNALRIIIYSQLTHPCIWDLQSQGTLDNLSCLMFSFLESANTLRPFFFRIPWLLKSLPFSLLSSEVSQNIWGQEGWQREPDFTKRSGRELGMWGQAKGPVLLKGRHLKAMDASVTYVIECLSLRHSTGAELWLGRGAKAIRGRCSP